MILEAIDSILSKIPQRSRARALYALLGFVIVMSGLAVYFFNIPDVHSIIVTWLKTHL